MASPSTSLSELVALSSAGPLRSPRRCQEVVAPRGRLSPPGPGRIGYAIGVGVGIVATAVWVAQVAPAGVPCGRRRLVGSIRAGAAVARVRGTSPLPRLPRRRRGRRCCCHCPSMCAPTALPWLLPPMLSSPCAVLSSDKPSSTPSRAGSTTASWWHRWHHGAVGNTISLAGGLRSDACRGRLSSPVRVAFGMRLE